MDAALGLIKVLMIVGIFSAEGRLEQRHITETTLEKCEAVTLGAVDFNNGDNGGMYIRVLCRPHPLDKEA